MRLRVAWPDLTGRKLRRWLLVAVLIAWGGLAYWHTHKPLLAGTHVNGPAIEVPADAIQLVADITAADAYGRPILSQAIFEEILGVVRSARQFLVLDYFLFNHQGRATPASAPLRPLSEELRDALIERRRLEPSLRVLLTVDPINEVYGAVPSADLALLRAAGVEVVISDLDRLRDSNCVYSAFWRLAIAWWSRSGHGRGWLPNPLDEDSEPVTFGAWARLVNFKANHRKVILGDDGHGGLVGVVTSANPHDASSLHSNIAIKIAGPALQPLMASELALARQSGWRGELNYGAPPMPPQAPPANAIQVKVLTEGAIRAALLQHVRSAGKGDFVDIAMFYISDRAIVEALLKAARRGVTVRLILDPNKDAFGHSKSGIPNRPVASELVAASSGAIHVRWYRTHGEQFHTKLVMVYGAQRLWFTLGSANLTRRNLSDYNLEANVGVELPRGAQLAVQSLEYFDTLWNNRALLGVEYTADYGVYADPAQSHYWLYRVLEATGMSTF